MMKQQWAAYVYSTELVQDNKAGSTTLNLSCEHAGQTSLVARVVYWDAMGHFFLETLGRDVPVTIVEKLIAEAHQRIKIK